jgi:exosortase
MMMTTLTRGLLFGAYCVALGLLSLDTLRALFALSRADETASHLVLVPLVSVVLVYQYRRSVFAAARTSWLAGLPVILAGAALLWSAAWMTPPSAAQGYWLTTAVASLVTLWIGGFLLCFGPQAFRAACFPLLFLAFMIPIPGSLLAAAVHVLKTGSAEVVDALFALTGTPYLREGFIFSLPRVTIEIADECSGIRSSIALLLTGVLAGHAFLQSPWTKALLMLAIVPLAILKNGIRIATLSLLATNVDPAYLAGRLHNEGGVVFFLITLSLLAPILTLLRRSETHRASLTQELI